jgi:transcriptional regulator with XRE-family HTH domain
MTQEQFGKACRVDQAQVSRYEHDEAPSEEVLRRMAKVAGIDWSLVVHLRQFYSSLLADASRGDAGPAATGLDLPILEPVLLALSPYWIELGRAEPEGQPPAKARHEADLIWSALERYPAQRRRQLIGLSLQVSRSWALAERVSHESEQMAAHKVEDALELAHLALAIAEQVPGEEGLRAQGYCWGHVANARRVGNDLSGADEAFVRAWDLWRAGGESDLAEWRLLDLEASLRRDERRFSEALELLDRARAASGDDPLAVGRILLKKEHVFEQMGDVQNALAALAEAAPFVEAVGDARQLFVFRFKSANHLYHLERYEAAAELLAQVRELAVQQANELDLLRVGWLSAKVAAGQGRTEEAIAGLEQVSRDFQDRDMPYDAALASLDLAVLWLKAGRTAEVRELAVEMGSIFKAQKFDHEALGALRLFCDAARQETASVALARRAIGHWRGEPLPRSSR